MAPSRRSLHPPLLEGLLCTLLAACAPATQEKPWLRDLPQEEPALVEIDLLSPLAERAGATLWGPPLPPYHHLVEALEALAERSAVRGLFLRAGPWGAGLAQATETARLLDKLREAGKPVYCHFDMADEPSYLWMGAGCDRILAPRAAILDVRGLAIHALYFGTTLREAGVEAEIFQLGEAKGAADALVTDHMPDPVRRSLQELLDDLGAERQDAIASRRQGGAKLRGALDGGPWTGDEALASGLIDAIAFDDAARERLRRRTKTRRMVRLSLRDTASPLEELLRTLAGETEVPRSGPRLAVVHLAGTITDGKRLQHGVIAAGPTVRALRRLADDPDVAAVVLRIDSPGGSALASERIWHAAHRVAKRKPLAVSVGGMAASGGYYVALAARRLFAEPTSIVGSIGVVGGKLNLQRLLQRFDIGIEAVEAGAHAGWSSPWRPLKPSERTRLRTLMRRTYRLFLHRVSEGRHLRGEALRRATAEARLWSGRRGKQVGLIDALGGLSDAMAWARTESGLGADAPVEHWPPRPGLLEAFEEERGASMQGGVAWPERLPPPIAEAWRLGRVLAREGIALHLPYLLRFE